MTRKHDILDKLVQAVRLLGELSDEFIFVGGSVVQILVTDEAAQDARPTVDVDVIVEASTRAQYYLIEERLARAGFHPSILESVICRFVNAEIKLDVIPAKEDILGFGSRWYE